jgi:REP element-mobilizing transposase RayT
MQSDSAAWCIGTGYVAAAFMAGPGFFRMKFEHKNIRLNASQYVGRKWYFVTICSAGRRKVLTRPGNAEKLMTHLLGVAKNCGMPVYAYCVMPDHLHVLVHGSLPTSDLLSFIKEFKQRTELEFHAKFGREFWQKKVYDRILRPRDSPERVAAYIWMNPVRQGLCRHAVEYPHSGSTVVDWEEIARVSEPWVPDWKKTSPATKVPTSNS